MIPDGFYNFLTRHNSKQWRVSLLVLSALAIFWLLRQTAVYSDQSLYFYTFSTIVQGFLALVAFLGAVVVYKLQIIEQELNDTRNRMENDLTQFSGQAAYSYSWAEALDEAQKIAENGCNSLMKGPFDRIAFNSEKLTNLSMEQRGLRSRMVDFSLLIFLNVGLALLALPISEALLTNRLYIPASFLLFVNILLSCLSMISAFKLIRIVLGYDFRL